MQARAQIRANLERSLLKLWYGPSWHSLPLWPLEAAFRLGVRLRRQAYDFGLLTVDGPAIPVIVVGNLTVGGTGKTPLVIWLVERLLQAGFRPGVTARGYGASAGAWPQRATADSDARRVGDETVLLARRTACPVIASGSERAAAARWLERLGCDVVVSDDGLQHHRLRRELEIAVVDVRRGFGNRHCLPAGPLREPLKRLLTVDCLVHHGPARTDTPAFVLGMKDFVNLADDRRRCGPENFRGQRVHAVAGIGDPERFFRALSAVGAEVIPHAFADHHDFSEADLTFGDDLPIVMTEKDAVKCRGLAPPHCWFAPVEVIPNAALTQELSRWIAKIQGMMAGVRQEV